MTKSGQVKSVKTGGSGRRVPMRPLVAGTFRELATVSATSSKLVFPSPTGRYIDLHNWRSRGWNPACEAAGLTPRRPYDCRHTYATWSLRAGLNTFQVAQLMGTSVEMIDRTYGHLAPDADEHEIAMLDAFDQESWARNGH